MNVLGCSTMWNANNCQHTGGSLCVIFKVKQCKNSDGPCWGPYDSSKHQQLFASWHAVTSQKTWTFRISNIVSQTLHVLSDVILITFNFYCSISCWNSSASILWFRTWVSFNSSPTPILTFCTNSVCLCVNPTSHFALQQSFSVYD
jgi:hypothetical protein